jgi:hypothetical protein
MRESWVLPLRPLDRLCCPPPTVLSGVLVIKPSADLYEDLVRSAGTLKSYDGGDTGTCLLGGSMAMADVLIQMYSHAAANLSPFLCRLSERVLPAVVRVGGGQPTALPVQRPADASLDDARAQPRLLGERQARQGRFTSPVTLLELVQFLACGSA